MASEPPITTAGGGMIGRITGLLLKPKEEWPRIAAEPMTMRGILLGWVVPLAAIGPLAGMIAALSNGFLLNGIMIATPIDFIVANFVMTWALAVLCTYLLALVIDALAPSFGGTKDPLAALKVAAFGSTAGYLSGIFQIWPPLVILSILGLYTYYLIYEGLPVLMKAPRDKTLVYMLVTFVVSVVLVILAGYVVRSITYTMLPPVPFGYGLMP